MPPLEQNSGDATARTLQTDDRQTTDGFAIANTERNVVTFGKNASGIL